MVGLLNWVKDSSPMEVWLDKWMVGGLDYEWLHGVCENISPSVSSSL